VGLRALPYGLMEPPVQPYSKKQKGNEDVLIFSSDPLNNYKGGNK
jgi:hypothetical protein